MKQEKKYLFPSDRKTIAAYLCLAVAIICVYGQVATHDFINYDTPSFIIQNPNIHEGIFFSSIKWAFTDGILTSNFYQPIPWISHIIDCHIYGLNPGGHHLTNVLLHIISTLLLFHALRRMTGALWRSFGVAALFGLHPLHVESVAWVVERKDIFSAIFWFLSMWAYACYVEKPNIFRYVVVVLCLLLGMLSKPMLVTLPFVLILLDYWPLKRFNSIYEYLSNLYRLVLEKWLLFILSIICSIAAYLTQDMGGALPSLRRFPLPDRVANALISYQEYLRKFLYPADLAIFYPFPETIPVIKIIIGASCLLFLTVTAIFTCRNYRFFIVGWLWFLGTMVPVLGIVKIGEFAMADRYAYIPMIGIYIAVCWGLSVIFERLSRKRLFITFCVVFLAVMMFATWGQVSYWKNTYTLFSHAERVTEKNYMAYYFIGTELQKAGMLSEAEKYYQKTLRYLPEYIAPQIDNFLWFGAGGLLSSIRFYNYGREEVLRGNPTEAAKYFRYGISVNPECCFFHYELGLLLKQQLRYRQASECFKNALSALDRAKLSPSDKTVVSAKLKQELHECEIGDRNHTQ